jgi:hypothetical protein
MKASKDLQFQLNQLKISGTMHLNHILKEELNQIHQAEFGVPINLQCASCVLSAAHKVNKLVLSPSPLQKVDKIQPRPKVEVKTVIDYSTWSRPQLFEKARELGLSPAKNIRTDRLIKLVENESTK